MKIKSLTVKKRYIFGAAVGFMLLLLFVTSFFSTFTVVGNSMEPELSDGDRIVVLKTKNPKPGDLIFFHMPASWNSSESEIGTAGDLLVKEIKAGPGDVLKFDGRVLTVNGEGIWSGECRNYNMEETVPSGAYFVMGSNSSVSLDSRSKFCSGASAYLVHSDEMLAAGKIIHQSS